MRQVRQARRSGPCEHGAPLPLDGPTEPSATALPAHLPVRPLAVPYGSGRTPLTCILAALATLATCGDQVSCTGDPAPPRGGPGAGAGPRRSRHSRRTSRRPDVNRQEWRSSHCLSFEPIPSTPFASPFNNAIWLAVLGMAICHCSAIVQNKSHACSNHGRRSHIVTDHGSARP